MLESKRLSIFAAFPNYAHHEDRSRLKTSLAVFARLTPPAALRAWGLQLALEVTSAAAGWSQARAPGGARSNLLAALGGICHSEMIWGI